MTNVTPKFMQILKGFNIPNRALISAVHFVDSEHDFEWHDVYYGDFLIV